MPYEKEIQILSELRSEYNCFDLNEREYYHALSEAIRSLKTERHGHWEHLYGGQYKCSNCGAWWGSEYADEITNDFHYCPNCGAKMDETCN